MVDGNNTYTGPTSVAAGILAIGSGNGTIVANVAPTSGLGLSEAKREGTDLVTVASGVALEIPTAATPWAASMSAPRAAMPSPSPTSLRQRQWKQAFWAQPGYGQQPHKILGTVAIRSVSGSNTLSSSLVTHPVASTTGGCSPSTAMTGKQAPTYMEIGVDGGSSLNLNGVVTSTSAYWKVGNGTLTLSGGTSNVEGTNVNLAIEEGTVVANKSGGAIALGGTTTSIGGEITHAVQDGFRNQWPEQRMSSNTAPTPGQATRKLHSPRRWWSKGAATLPAHSP